MNRIFCIALLLIVGCVSEIYASQHANCPDLGYLSIIKSISNENNIIKFCTESDFVFPISFDALNALKKTPENSPATGLLQVDNLQVTMGIIISAAKVDWLRNRTTNFKYDHDSARILYSMNQFSPQEIWDKIDDQKRDSRILEDITAMTTQFVAAKKLLEEDKSRVGKNTDLNFVIGVSLTCICGVIVFHWLYCKFFA